jgi:hypothetical protein
MDCRITFEGDLMLINLAGPMTNEDFEELARLIREVEVTLPCTPHRLTDISQLQEIHLTFQSMSDRIHLRKNLVFPNEFKSAIVAPEPLHYGVARMFQAVNNHHQIDIRVFRELAAARAWLASTDPATKEGCTF